MKILLDECIDQRLAADIYHHEVKTVPQMGWANLKDGQLLTLAQTNFEVLVTVDRNLPHQQDLRKYNIAVVILCAKSNRLADLQPLVPELIETIPKALPGTAAFIGL